MKFLSQTEVDQLRHTFNMKFLVILAVAVASAAAAEIPYTGTTYVKSDESSAPIVRSEFESHPDGHYYSAYETGNGIYSQSEGVVKNPNSDNAALEIKGTVKYTAPDGTLVNLEWLADETGAHFQGSHIPVAPPIPDAILRSIQYIAEHPAPVERVVKKP